MVFRQGDGVLDLIGEACATNSTLGYLSLIDLKPRIKAHYFLRPLVIIYKRSHCGSHNSVQNSVLNTCTEIITCTCHSKENQTRAMSIPVLNVSDLVKVKCIVQLDSMPLPISVQ